MNGNGASVLEGPRQTEREQNITFRSKESKARWGPFSAFIQRTPPIVFPGRSRLPAWLALQRKGICGGCKNVDFMRISAFVVIMIRTMEETSFVYRDKRGFFAVSCECSRYIQIGKAIFAPGVCNAEREAFCCAFRDINIGVDKNTWQEYTLIMPRKLVKRGAQYG